MSRNLDNHHRDTLERILKHPASSNIEWHQVLSLLEAVGTTESKHNGKLEVTLGAETNVQPPRGKDIGPQMIVDLCRMLTNAGYAPGRASYREEPDGE